MGTRVDVDLEECARVNVTVRSMSNRITHTQITLGETIAQAHKGERHRYCPVVINNFWVTAASTSSLLHPSRDGHLKCFWMSL